MTLLDPVFLRRLERLRVEARRAFPGTTKGERRSTRRGSSVEFADFRDYSRGDDFRHIDWNVYARLDRLVLRLFVEEEDVRIDILIDSSPSMAFGSPLTKFDYARRAAAALGYLGLAGLDRVAAGRFHVDLGPRMRPVRGRGQIHRLLDFLERATLDEPGEGTDLASAIGRFDRETRRPGIVFVISDFLAEADFHSAVRRLLFRKFDVNLVQVLAEEEIDPHLDGDLLLVDAETGREVEFTANAAALQAYRHAVHGQQRALEQLRLSAGVGYARVTTGLSFEELLLGVLRRRGLVGQG
jgi:uncharacterized protein (DUF58 family)